MRRSKKGNYSVEDRKKILQAAISDSIGSTITQKQVWLMNQGVHRPGFPSEPVSESAIKYWKNLHRKLTVLNESIYNETMNGMLNSPPSYRKLKEGIKNYISEISGSNASE